MRNVTTVIKLPDGSTKIRDGQAGVTITGRAEGNDFNCDVEYGATANEARAMMIIGLHWLKDTYPDMLVKALMGFFLESGMMKKGAKQIVLKFEKKEDENNTN